MSDSTPEPTPDEPDDQVSGNLTPDVPAGSGTDTDLEDTGRGNPEAARYRKQLRATQVENTVLQARVDQMIRNRIQDYAAEHLADGNDIWREPRDIADLCDDTGLPDPGRVRAHVDALISTHPHWGRRRPATPAASAVTSDASPYDSAPQANWSDVLKGGASG